jgi:pimeloyl-ACP methyl ester carboxylesterase
MVRAMRFGVGVLAVLGGLAIATPDTVARDLGAATLHGRSRASFASRREPDAARLRGSSLPEIYLLRGLFNVFSLGMDDLAAKLQEQGFSAVVDNHASWSALAERIIAARQAGSKRQIVLIGHSLGGDDVIKLAERLNQAGIAVDLLMPVDPVSPGAVPGNVRRVVNYFQSNNGFGQAVRPGVGFRGVLVNSDLETNRRDLRDPTTGHTTIDKGVKVQLDILREVMRVRGSSVAQRRGAASSR